MLFGQSRSIYLWQKELNRFSDFSLNALKKQEADRIRLDNRANIVDLLGKHLSGPYSKFLAINNCITAVRNLILKDSFAKFNCTCDTDIGRINNTISSLGSYFAKKSKLDEYTTT